MTKSIVQVQEKAEKVLLIDKGGNKVIVTSEGTPNFDSFVAKLSSIIAENEYETIQKRLMVERGR
ncbi:hypothetical protein ACFVP8_06455 [Viridibacillus arvi]|uniref:hypothetical protein n=1 Tax=Viridibacillus arvi TaxID=263475 RepID=UPI0036BBFF88